MRTGRTRIPVPAPARGPPGSASGAPTAHRGARKIERAPAPRASAMLCQNIEFSLYLLFAAGFRFGTVPYCRGYTPCAHATHWFFGYGCHSQNPLRYSSRVAVVTNRQTPSPCSSPASSSPSSSSSSLSSSSEPDSSCSDSDYPPFRLARAAYTADIAAPLAGMPSK